MTERFKLWDCHLNHGDNNMDLEEYVNVQTVLPRWAIYAIMKKTGKSNAKQALFYLVDMYLHECEVDEYVRGKEINKRDMEETNERSEKDETDRTNII